MTFDGLTLTYRCYIRSYPIVDAKTFVLQKQIFFGALFNTHHSAEEP